MEGEILYLRMFKFRYFQDRGKIIVSDTPALFSQSFLGRSLKSSAKMNHGVFNLKTNRGMTFSSQKNEKWSPFLVKKKHIYIYYIYIYITPTIFNLVSLGQRKKILFLTPYRQMYSKNYKKSNSYLFSMEHNIFLKLIYIFIELSKMRTF